MLQQNPTLPPNSAGNERRSLSRRELDREQSLRGQPGDVFGDQLVAAAMIDRIVHHADVLTLKGSSYRLKDTGIDTLPSARADNTAQ